MGTKTPNTMDNWKLDSIKISLLYKGRKQKLYNIKWMLFKLKLKRKNYLINYV